MAYLEAWVGRQSIKPTQCHKWGLWAPETCTLLLSHDIMFMNF